jgi:acyl carrier protein
MSWRDYFKREQLDATVLQALARERFPNHSGEVAGRVMMVFHAQFRVGSKHLLPNARLVEDLGFDDFDFIEMIKAVEREFKFQIRLEDLERGATLDGLIECVER